jgi:hypothetical protein
MKRNQEEEFGFDYTDILPVKLGSIWLHGGPVAQLLSQLSTEQTRGSGNSAVGGERLIRSLHDVWQQSDE